MGEVYLAEDIRLSREFQPTPTQSHYRNRKSEVRCLILNCGLECGRERSDVKLRSPETLEGQSYCLRDFKLEFFMIRKRVNAQVFGHPDVQLLIEHRMYDALIVYQ